MPNQNDHFDERVNWRVDDFCRAYGIGRTTLYAEAKRGAIKLIKIGGSSSPCAAARVSTRRGNCCDKVEAYRRAPSSTRAANILRASNNTHGKGQSRGENPPLVGVWGSPRLIPLPLSLG